VASSADLPSVRIVNLKTLQREAGQRAADSPKKSRRAHLLRDKPHSHLRNVLVGLLDLLLPRADHLPCNDLVQLPAQPQSTKLASALRFDRIDDGRGGEGLQFVVVATASEEESQLGAEGEE